MAGSETIVIFTTSPRGQSARIAEALVERHIAACVNIVNVRSIYRWKGEMQHDEEDLLIIKTITGKKEEAIRTIRDLHTYELPEAIAIPVTDGYAPYLAWVEQETSG